MKNLITALLIICLTTSCAYSVTRLAKDDKLRHQIILDCLKIGVKAKDQKNCINAAKAQAQVTGDTVNKLKNLLN